MSAVRRRTCMRLNCTSLVCCIFICTPPHQAMNRNNEHVSAYLLAELGTSGSLDGQQRLVVKGRFLPKSFETVLRRYVNE